MERLSETLTRGAFRQLRARGWVSIPHAVDPTLCEVLRREIGELLPTFVPNTTRFVSSGGSVQHLTKRGIIEADIVPTPVQRKNAPILSSLVDDTHLRTLSSVYFPQLTLRQQSIKVQRNAGKGSCFPLHYDSDEHVDSRKITAILYLNRDWEDEHGGELRLYPHPATPVDLQPREGTLVLFSSCHMVHRVLPSYRERFCVTFWLYGTSSLRATESENYKEATRAVAQLVQQNCSDAHEFVPHIHEILHAKPRNRKHLYKHLLKDEWNSSMIESHASPAESQILRNKHRNELDALHSALNSSVHVAAGLPSSPTIGPVTRALQTVLNERQVVGEPAVRAWF